MNRTKTVLMIVGLMAFVQVTFAQLRRDVPKLFEEAETAHDEGNYKEALRILNECIKLDPAFMPAYMKRGSTREQLNDLPGALTDYSIYLEEVTEDPDATLARGLLHFRQGHFDLAKLDFQKLLKMKTGPTTTILYRQSSFGRGTDMITTVQSGGRSSYLNYIGLCETKLNNYPAAIIAFDSAIRRDPREADYYVNRGIAREAAGDPLASDDYRKALAIEPSHGIAKHNLSVLQAKGGDKQQAETMLTDVLEADSSMAYAYLQRAQQRFEAGYYKGALDDYNAVLRMEEKDPELFLARGLTREKLKDLQGAFSDYTKAIDLKEDMVKAWVNRGNVLLKMNRHQDAIEDYSVAITYAPDLAAAFYNRGIAKYKLKHAKEACIDIRQAESMGFKGDEKTIQKICAATQ
jgi:tetratricopeptide (TPR) repeat protein